MSRSALLTLTLLVAAPAAAQPQTLDWSAASGVLNATNEQGLLVTSIRFADSRMPIVVDASPDVVLLANGMYVSSDGRLLARAASGAAPPFGLAPRTDEIFWDDFHQLMPPPPTGTADAHHPPFFDSVGDAWVFVTHIETGDYELRLHVSDGTTGDWTPEQTIVDSTNYVSGADSAIDADDNVWIAFRDIAGTQRLYARGYDPETGWGPLEQIYATGNFFNAVEVGIDETGTAVVVFNPRVGGPDTVWSLRRDAATGDWSTPGQLSPPGADTVLPTIIRNRTGDVMYLVYLVRSGAEAGLYWHRWDSTAQAWSSADEVPGASIAGFDFFGGTETYPAVVDSAGEVTVLWETATSPYNVYASRTIDGVWQEPVPLLEPFDRKTSIDVFGDLAVSPAGTLLGVTTRFESVPGESINRFYTMRFSPDSGWSTENPYTSGATVGTRTRVTFYNCDQAVATVVGQEEGRNELLSLLYNGEAWVEDPLAIPGQQVAFYADLVAADGAALLVAEISASGNQGIRARFLRAPNTGDLNCDGAIDGFDIDPFALALTDPAGYQAAYPGCPRALADVNCDGNVDGFDIDPFVILLTR